MVVTSDVSHAEMGPYVTSAAAWSVNQAVTAVLIVVSSSLFLQTLRYQATLSPVLALDAETTSIRPSPSTSAA